MTSGFAGRNGGRNRGIQGRNGAEWEVRRRRGTPLERAERRVGRLDRRTVPGGREGYQHARAVWETARRAVAARADVLERETAGAGPGAFEGQLDLVLVGALGAHLAWCQDCWVTWIDGWRPGDILTAAVRRRPAGAVLRAAELEARARQTRGKR